MLQHLNFDLEPMLKQWQFVFVMKILHHIYISSEDSEILDVFSNISLMWYYVNITKMSDEISDIMLILLRNF